MTIKQNEGMRGGGPSKRPPVRVKPVESKRHLRRRAAKLERLRLAIKK